MMLFASEIYGKVPKDRPAQNSLTEDSIVEERRDALLFKTTREKSQ
jgi:hypothetical protein